MIAAGRLYLSAISHADNEKPEASDDIALWLADEFTQVSDLPYILVCSPAELTE